MDPLELEKAFKSRLAINTDEIDELSTYLSEKWNMFCFAETTHAFTHFVQKNEKAVMAFWKILQDNESKKDSPSSYAPEKQRALYDKLARAPFGPWTMGVRWPQILSSLAAVDRLFAVRKPARVLEIGCGTGFACDWLQSRYSFHYSGIDFSSAAIASAKRHISSREGATFNIADINNFESNEQFDLIFSIAGFPRSLNADLIDQVARHLGKEGLIYVQVAGPPGPASKWVAKPQCVNLSFEDSTGGLEFSGGMYNHTSNYVFTTKDIAVTPLIYNAEESWHAFATCMNSGRIHERERNFGYFNANGRPNTPWPLEEGKWETFK